MTFHEWLDTYGRGLRAGGPVTLYEFAEAAWNASEDDCARETHKMKEERDEARASNEVNKARALAAEDEAAKIRADNQNWIKRCAALSSEVERLGPWMSAAMDDQRVCAEMKRDIDEYLEALALLRSHMPSGEKEG